MNLDAPAIKELLKYINGTPELLSLLYDLDLMPEQTVGRLEDRRRMFVLAAWHRGKRVTDGGIAPLDKSTGGVK